MMTPEADNRPSARIFSKYVMYPLLSASMKMMSNCWPARVSMLGGGLRVSRSNIIYIYI